MGRDAIHLFTERDPILTEIELGLRYDLIPSTCLATHINGDTYVLLLEAGREQRSRARDIGPIISVPVRATDLRGIDLDRLHAETV